MPKKPSKKNAKKIESDDEPDAIEDINEEDIDKEDDDDDDDEPDIDDTEIIDSDAEDKELSGLGDDTGVDGGECSFEDINDSTDYVLNDNGNIQSEHNKQEFLTKKDRISANRLTKYEMVRILGERTKQLMAGAKPLIKNHKDLSYDKIAEEEFIRNMIPFKIKRPLPNGKFEIWTLDELNKEHLLSMLE